MTRFTITAVLFVALAISSSSDAFMVKQNLQRLSRTSSSTALNMNLFDRFTRVAKSNLNNILKNLEDPEKIMNQALEDMQVSYTESQNQYLTNL
jgi:phage shock protein A